MQLGEIAKANPAIAIGSYPFFDPQGPIRMSSCAPAMHRSLRLQNVRLRTCWSESGKHNQVGELALSRRKQGFESPRERQQFQ